MAQAQPKQYPNDSSDQRFGKHRLDRMVPRMARNLVMFSPSEAVVTALMEMARKEIPGIAETADVLKLVAARPDCMMALARRSRFDPNTPDGEGFIAMLPLNLLGLQHLALGTFNAASPDLRLLAKPDEKPAGIYLWAVYAPGPLVAGMALFMEKMTQEPYAGVDIYSRPNTPAGIQFNIGMGFIRGSNITGIEAPNVWKFARTPTRPPYDSYVPGASPGEIGVTIARTFEDLNRVMSIRSAVYIGEQECPYDEEYDGNDLTATHLLAYIGDEPVGCLRIRYFADFAKIERLAIRKEFRKTRAAFQLVRGAFKLCQAKGYTKVYGHSQARLVNFWSRFGFRVPDNARHFVFSDFDYVEIIADIERDPQAIDLSADPYVIIRPEGRWHKPGILEKSATRAVTRPSVG